LIKDFEAQYNFPKAKMHFFHILAYCAAN